MIAGIDEQLGYNELCGGISRQRCIGVKLGCLVQSIAMHQLQWRRDLIVPAITVQRRSAPSEQQTVATPAIDVSTARYLSLSLSVHSLVSWSVSSERSVSSRSNRCPFSHQQFGDRKRIVAERRTAN